MWSDLDQEIRAIGALTINTLGTEPSMTADAENVRRGIQLWMAELIDDQHLEHAACGLRCEVPDDGLILFGDRSGRTHLNRSYWMEGGSQAN